MKPAIDDLMSQERYARAAWSRIAEPGDVTAARLIQLEGVVEALDLVRQGVTREAERFRPRVEQLDLARDLEVGARFGARIVVPGDPEWPEGLDDLELPPYCLWVRGPLDLGERCRRSVAVVGARSATAYGESMAADIAAGLAERDFCVVSGAAFGIDAAAHRGALAVEGATAAVLAGGVERPYPASHAALIQQIGERGAVASEVAPGSAPMRYRFLQRNRLIATMTAGTLIVEAGLRSGSLSTARHAREHGRVVAAVPGPVTSMMSAGCHRAVRDGYATLVTDAAEVAEVMGDLGADLAPRGSEPSRPGDGLEEIPARVLSAMPLTRSASVDQLTKSSGLSVGEVLAALGQLELHGLVEQRLDGWGKARRK